MYNLPSDILAEISNLSDLSAVVNLSSACKKFNSNLKGILAEKKRCFDIQHSKCTIHKIPWNTRFNIGDSKKSLGYLHRKGIKAEFGDIFKYKASPNYDEIGSYIFNGKELMDFDFLPEQFRVIENVNGKRYSTHHWCDYLHTMRIWFDHTKYIDQLIKNVKYDKTKFEGTYSVYSHFISDDKRKCYIVCEYDGSLQNYEEQMWRNRENIIVRGYNSVHGRFIKYSDGRKVFYSKNYEELYNVTTMKLKESIVEDVKNEFRKILNKKELLYFKCNSINYPTGEQDICLFVDI